MRIFRFLDLRDHYNGPNGVEIKVPWNEVLTDKHFNENKGEDREPILEETETVLRRFYEPYDNILSRLLNDSLFSWKGIYKDVDGVDVTLRDKQVSDADHDSFKSDPSPDENEHEHDGRHGRIATEGFGRIPHREIFGMMDHHSHGPHTNKRGHEEAMVSVPDMATLTPRSFSLYGLMLPESDTLSDFITDQEFIPDPVFGPWKGNIVVAGQQLCLATFGLGK